MCGIAGIFSNNNLLQRIGAATACLQHRGPEDHGIYSNVHNTLALGHSRLCIIDRTAAARQPLTYQSRYTIVHNGELYNYLEVKKGLESRGYGFHSQSDTEVMAAAYAAYGKECLQHFDGAFAFAIWDQQEQVLFAARDRFGEKPFYFFYNEDEFLFASEMKALWQAGVPKEVNQKMLYNYLTIGYTSNPFNPQETFYNNIQKLPAASCLTFAMQTHELSIENYWQVDAEVNTGIGEATAVEQFNFLLTESIHKRLRSDVPIGTSLSGGLDSSSIVAFSAQIPSKQYTHQCFTAVFDGFEKDERQYAQAVAAEYDLHQHLVRVDADDLVKEMDQLMLHQEEPVGSSSVLAQYKVYEAAKAAGITVLLDGQGADEVLAGYHKYYHWYWQELYAKKRLASSGELKAVRALGVNELFGVKNKAFALFPHFAASLLQNSKAKKASRQPGLNPDFAADHKKDFYYSLPAQLDLNGVLYFNTFVYGLEELLRYADRNSMAHAVEVRLPFLNHQLVEFLFSLPPQFKIHRGWTKWLLRQSVQSLLPAQIVWRAEKVGFEPPQKAWMQNPMVQEKIQEAKKLLVSKDVLSKTVLQQPIVPADAHAANNLDWRYWSASYLFR
ncbi:asparagine synthase (glutamine-hydrolyzing) [Chitinophagaceae bacterium LB-8]|uniref:asparagine synthase (glutamine-hydrolyzing) n=1 Tax=Paraflavisolibacter caeni TaxID=2982496 RepID=A0A9X3BJU5_9BACT|nr:asparagine synthase (glutamine-hydrolyzing) [Paraflavisolibacter caeni]MCU7551663.1 asparagine synthase (glutamine-hydrolyzing) [Paraflavisolibacter caeni]